MYEKFFNFKEKPFSIIPDATYFYQSRQHRLALAQLEYGLMNRVGFIVISGDIGTGKTTLIRTLLAGLDTDIEVASIFNTTVNPSEFLDLVLQEFGIEPGSGNRSDKLNRLRKHLVKLHGQGKKALLIIDESQNLSIETLEEVRLLSNMEMEKEYLLHIVLVGQTELREKLLHPALSQLAQRIAVHYNLAPLSEEETEQYIMYRLRVASNKGEPGVVFAKEAVKAIYEHTNGIPRLINVLCDLCLVYAYADELPGINLHVVEEVVKNQEASGFSSLFTARASYVQDDDREDAVSSIKPAARPVDNESLGRLEAKVAELQSGLIAVNRTVQDFLLEHAGAVSRREQEQQDALNRVIDVQKVEIERLKAERKDLLKRIYELSSQLKDREAATSQEDTLSADKNSAAAAGHDDTTVQPGTAAVIIDGKSDRNSFDGDVPFTRKRKTGSSRMLYIVIAGVLTAACVVVMAYEPWRAKVLDIILPVLPF